MEGQGIKSRSSCFFENLMQPEEHTKDYPVDSICEGCRYHEPEWEYRFCRFTECPGIKGFMTFRDEEFRKDCSHGSIQG